MAISIKLQSLILGLIVITIIMQYGYCMDEERDRKKNEQGDSDEQTSTEKKKESTKRKKHKKLDMEEGKVKKIDVPMNREWTEEEAKMVTDAHPAAFREDFFTKMPTITFKKNMRTLSIAALKQKRNPTIRKDFRKAIDKIGKKGFSREDLIEIGPGLLILARRQLQKIDPKLLMEAHFAVNNEMSNDGNDESEKMGKFSLGQLLKRSLSKEDFKNPEILKGTVALLATDNGFMRKVDKDALKQSLPDLKNLTFSEKEARAILRKLRGENGKLEKDDSNIVIKLGSLMRGVKVSDIKEMDVSDLRGAINDLKDIDFGEEQTRAIVKRITSKTPDFENVKTLGKLASGLSMKQIKQLESVNIIELIKTNDVVFSHQKLEQIAEKFRRDGVELREIVLYMPKTFTPEDLEKLFKDTPKEFVDLTSDVQWDSTQSLTVSKLVMSEIDDVFESVDEDSMYTVMLGLLPKSLKNIMEDALKNDNDTSRKIIEIANYEYDCFNNVQLAGILDAVNMDIETKPEVVLNAQNVSLMGNLLAMVNDKNYNKLTFDEDGEEVFLEMLGNLEIHKMSRSRISKIATRMLKMRAHKAMEPDERLRALGNLVLGLRPEQLESFGGDVILDNLDILRNLPFNKKQAQAILISVDTAEPEWSCNSELVARVGPLLQHLNKTMKRPCNDALLASMSSIMDDLKMQREAVEKRKEAGFAREEEESTDDKGVGELVMQIGAIGEDDQTVNRTERDISKREAITAQMVQLSCGLINQLDAAAKMMPEMVVKTMPGNEISTCLEDIGKIKWSVPSTKDLLNGLISDVGIPSTWDEDTVRRAGSLVSGLRPELIKELPITETDTLKSIGSSKMLDPEQLKAGLDRWMENNNKKDAGAVTESEMASMSEFVCGFSTDQIKLIPDDSVRRGLGNIGRSGSCDKEQYETYADRISAIWAKENNGEWDLAKVATMGTLIGYFGKDAIRSLTGDQLSVIRPNVIGTLPIAAIKEFSKEQMQAMGENQVSAITVEQFKSLSPDIQAIVGEKTQIGYNNQAPRVICNSAETLLAALIVMITSLLM